MIETTIKTVAKGAAIKLALYAAVVALALGMSAGWYLTSGWYGPRLENAELRAKTLGEALEKQNKEVDRLGKETKKLQADVKEAQAAAKKRSAVRQAKAMDIMAIPAPADPDQRCTAAENLVRQELFK